jgi:hypothetical protein
MATIMQANGTLTVQKTSIDLTGLNQAHHLILATPTIIIQTIQLVIQEIQDIVHLMNAMDAVSMVSVELIRIVHVQDKR